MGSKICYNNVMIIVGIFGWWYGAGFGQRLRGAAHRLLRAYDFFSIDLLLATLLAPFRQISAGAVQGGLGVQFRAAIDQLVSRLIGAFVRLIMIIIGIVWLLITLLIALVEIVLWALVPLLPLVGAGMFAVG